MAEAVPAFRGSGTSASIIGTTNPLGNEEPEMLDPTWIAAGAETAVAVENGVMMIGKHKPKDSGPTPAPTVAFQGLSNEALITAAFILAVALLASALIIHHGLVA
jgi:hypothetical protein